jgi:hypothetical protein
VGERGEREKVERRVKWGRRTRRERVGRETGRSKGEWCEFISLVSFPPPHTHSSFASSLSLFLLSFLQAGWAAAQVQGGLCSPPPA